MTMLFIMEAVMMSNSMLFHRSITEMPDRASEQELTDLCNTGL